MLKSFTAAWPFVATLICSVQCQFFGNFGGGFPQQQQQQPMVPQQQQQQGQAFNVQSPLIASLLSQVRMPPQFNNNNNNNNNDGSRPAQVAPPPQPQQPPQLPQSQPISLVAPAPQPQQPIVSSGTSEPQMVTLNCQGQRYLISVETAQYYSCCGSQIYYWPTHQCASGPTPSTAATSPTQPVMLPPTAPRQPTQQAPQPVQQGQTGQQSQPGATLTCNGVQYAFDSPQALSRFACCGKTVYDVQNQQCNDTSMASMPDFSRLFQPILGMNPMFAAGQQSPQPQQQTQQPQQPPIPLSSVPQPLPTPQYQVPAFQPPQPQQPQQLPQQAPTQPQMDLNTACSTTYTCCDGFRPIYDPNRAYRCCPGAGPYDPVVSSCVAAN